MSHRKDILLRLDDAIMGINPNRPVMSRHPQLHRGNNPVFMTMRSEMYYLQKINIKQRREKLRELFTQDFIRNDMELRKVGLAFINRFH